MIAGARDSAPRIGTVWDPKGDGNAVHNGLVWFVFFNKGNQQYFQCFSCGLTYATAIAASLRQKTDFTLFSVKDHGNMRVHNSKVQN